MCSQAIDETEGMCTMGPRITLRWSCGPKLGTMVLMYFILSVPPPNSQSTQLYFSFSVSTLEAEYFVKSIMFRALRDQFKVRPFVFINICDLNYWKQVANRSWQPWTAGGNWWLSDQQSHQLPANHFDEVPGQLAAPSSCRVQSEPC